MRTLILLLVAVFLVTLTFGVARVQSQNLESVLLDAAASGQTDFVKSLLDSGANIESKNKLGATSLIFASIKGHSQVVKLLLERGADVNVKATTGITPLMAAATAGDAEVVKLLLEKGADVSAKDQKGRTALNLAEATGATEVYALLKVVDKSSTPAAVPVPGMPGPGPPSVPVAGPTGTASVPAGVPTGTAHTEVIRSGDSQGGLTVRAEPLPKGQAVAYLPVGSKVTYVGEASNGWVKLSAPTTGGWVAESYLGSRNPEASVISVDSPEQCLRVRNGPGMSYEKIGCLPQGAKLKLSGTVQKDWAQIVEPMAGWVTARQIQAPGLTPEKVAAQGVTRRSSSEERAQDYGATGAEFSDQAAESSGPAESSGQPLASTGADKLLDFIQQKIQGGGSAPIDNKPADAVGQNPQPLPANAQPAPDPKASTAVTVLPDGSTLTVTKNPDGSTTTVEKNPNGNTSTLTNKPDGSSTNLVTNSKGDPVVLFTRDKTGAGTSTTFGPDGKKTVNTVDANGKHTSSTVFGPDGKKITTTVYGKGGGSAGAVTTTFGPDGRRISVETNDATTGKTTTVLCDAPLKCPQTVQNLNTKQQQLKAGAKTLKADTKSQGLVGAKAKVKNEVLGQIEGKPRGDLIGAKEKVKTELLDQSKVGSLKVGPLQVKPKAQDFTVGQKEKLGVIPRSQSSDRIFQDASKEKLKTGVVDQFKGKAKVQDVTVGQKEKLNITPRSQSVGRNFQFQGGGVDKQKVQTQAVQQNQFKSKNWGSSAGSSDPLQRIRR